MAVSNEFKNIEAAIFKLARSGRGTLAANLICVIASYQEKQIGKPERYDRVCSFLESINNEYFLEIGE